MICTWNYVSSIIDDLLILSYRILKIPFNFPNSIIYFNYFPSGNKISLRDVRHGITYAIEVRQFT